MGFLDSLGRALEKLTAEPAPTPRRPAPELPPPPAGRTRGTAVLLEAVRERRGEDNVGGLGETLLGAPYDFVLGVTLPGQPTYQVAKRDRVPGKVEDGGLLRGEVHLAPGIEVPVHVGSDPTDVTIDWDAYLAMPGRAEDAELARNRKAWAGVKAQFAKQPAAFQQQMLDGSRMASLSHAQAVVDGHLTREAFEKQYDQVYRSGHIRVEDLAAAVAIIRAAERPSD